jgi:hypothetical protein
VNDKGRWRLLIAGRPTDHRPSNEYSWNKLPSSDASLYISRFVINRWLVLATLLVLCRPARIPHGLRDDDTISDFR